LAEPDSLREVRIDPVTPEAVRLWSMTLALAADLGAHRDWSLIGGLMVQLHGFEHEDDLRPTVDIDILGAAKRQPAMTEQIASILIKARVVAERRREKFDSDRQDLIRLLTYVEDPRALAREEQLKASERKWLRDISAALNFNDPSLPALFPGSRLEKAEQAFRLLSGS